MNRVRLAIARNGSASSDLARIGQKWVVLDLNIGRPSILTIRSILPVNDGTGELKTLLPGILTSRKLFWQKLH